jgi:4'-phosphopantetheinyl transferase superfamily protein
MLKLIALDAERARLGELQAGNPRGIYWDRLLFSAKESVYKTWFPVARTWLGFESADIIIDPRAGTFTARLLVPGPLVGGTPLTSLNGRWLADNGFLVTAAVLPALPASVRVRKCSFSSWMGVWWPWSGRGTVCSLFPIAAGSCERRWRGKGRAAPA